MNVVEITRAARMKQLRCLKTENDIFGSPK